jgi:hypothetical protein
MFINHTYYHNWMNISTTTRLASNEIFSPSNTSGNRSGRGLISTPGRSTTAAEIFLSWLLGKAAIHKQHGGQLRNRKTYTNTSASKADDSARRATTQRNPRCSDMRHDTTGDLRHEHSVLTHGNSSDKQTHKPVGKHALLLTER